ncbi:MAG: hypothetical protein HBSAPP03_18720 [Phycisphaerae bacterium]|nr:MAG: hypothetical protein HBSAPP03_18720 [Phycisphaerae bacterium]
MPSVTLSDHRAAQVRAALRAHYFTWDDPAFFASEAFAFDLEQHVRVRYEECAGFVVPWVNRVMSLAGRRLVEIGCGTGSSTAAFGEAVGPEGRIVGYDINAPSVHAARARLEVFGLRNAALHVIRPEELTAAMRAHHPGGADIVLCYAVLEHQTLAERLDTLSTAWDVLRPGGLLVVGDSPNRLTWMDYHTSGLPYFDCLPEALAMMYAHRAPRAEFAKAFADSRGSHGEHPTQAEIERLTRWGRGISYHEFELVLGDLEPLVVADSFDPEIMAAPHREVSLEERLLFAFAAWHSPRVPPAFLRSAIEVILRKPGSPHDAPALRRVIPSVKVV